MVNVDFVEQGLLRDKVQYKTNYFCDKKLGYLVCKDTIICPAHEDDRNIGVYDNGKMLRSTGIMALYNHNYPDAFFLEETINDIIEEDVIYLGVIHNVWGHFITDSLKHIWFLKSSHYKQFEKLRIVYISIGKGVNRQFRELFSLYGINIDDFIEIKETTKIAGNIVIPDPSFYYDILNNTHVFTIEYKNTIDYIKQQWKYKTNFKESKNIKVYYSNSKKTHHIGEKTIDKFFKKLDFLVVHPEKLSFSKQLTLLSNCSFFVSTDGSSMHNSIFLQDKTKALIILRGNYSSNYQETLNYLNDLNCYYINSSLSIMSSKTKPWKGPFLFYVSDMLCKFFDKPSKPSFQTIKCINHYLNHLLLYENIDEYDCNINDIEKVLKIYSSILSKRKILLYSLKIRNKLFNFFNKIF